MAKYGLVRLWNEVVELLSQGKSMTSSLQVVAVKKKLSRTAISNAVHSLGQVRTPSMTCVSLTLCGRMPPNRLGYHVIALPEHSSGNDLAVHSKYFNDDACTADLTITV